MNALPQRCPEHGVSARANGGAYAICRSEVIALWSSKVGPGPFGKFEDDVLPHLVDSGVVHHHDGGHAQVIDIGTPARYAIARDLFQRNAWKREKSARP